MDKSDGALTKLITLLRFFYYCGVIKPKKVLIAILTQRVIAYVVTGGIVFMMQLPVLANRIDKIPFAGIRKVFQKANELEAQGQKVIHFEIGRPDFDTPMHIKKAAKKALDKGFVHYAPNNGILALREAMAQRLNADKKLSFDPEREIMVTAGGQEALYLTFMSILNPGDEVIMPDPCFGPFSLVVGLAGGVPVKIPLKPADNYAYDLVRHVWLY